MTTYVLAGGCFWCLDAIYRRIKGVEAVVSGYAGGDASDAQYDLVSTGSTNHAESVQVTFDEKIIPVDVILDLFFTLHDPTSLNRQGADVGPQYRSAIFYANDDQKTAAEAARDRAQTIWERPIVTEITPLEAFYAAEPYHQDYFAHNPQAGYCTIVIAPKISKVRQKFTRWFKDNEED